MIEPLQGVRTDADGFKDYIYQVAGGTAIVPIPPSGFDFTTASDTVLRKFGLPPRPEDPNALPAWEQQIRGVQVQPPKPFLIGVPWLQPATAITSLPWSGYMNTSNYNQYTDSYADYHEPSTTSACNGDAVAVWAGLGGWFSGNLAQAGTFPHVNGIPDHSTWWYVMPELGGAQLYGGTVAVGDDIQVEVQWEPSPGNNEFYFSVYDSTTRTTSIVFWPTNSYNGQSSEFIVERPKVNNVLPPIRKFSAVTFGAAQTNNIGMQNFPLDVITMTNASGTPLAVPGTNNGQSFTDTWKQCG